MTTLYTNARIITMDNDRPQAASLLVMEGRIAALYDAPPMVPGVQRIDLQGAVVVPGFIDAHTHSFEGGLYSLGADLSEARSIQEALDIIGQTPLLSGLRFAWRFDESHMDEARFPTRAELDAVSLEPLLLRRVCGHSCQVNSAALAAIDWRGEPPVDDTGLLRGRQNDIAAHWFHRRLDDEAVLMCYERAANIALAAGCTTVHTMIGDADRDPLHYRLLRDNLHRYPVEFILYPQVFDADVAAELGARRVGGCILVDGSFGSHTAALRQPYADQPHNSGRLYRSDDEWRAFVGRAQDLGLQTAAHAIGDAAIEQYVAAVEHAQARSDKRLRHMVIHAELTDDALLDRIAAAGMTAAMQPVFDSLWASDLYVRVLGEKRAARTNRLAGMTMRGISVAGGSDWYITPLDPLLGVRAATHMRNPQESLTPEQALALWTTNAAYVSGDEKRLGRLAPGFQADFTCLDRSPLEMDAAPKVLRVVKRGATVYEA